MKYKIRHHIQESCFRTISGSLDSSDCHIFVSKGWTGTFLGVVRIEKVPEKSTFFDFFATCGILYQLSWPKTVRLWSPGIRRMILVVHRCSYDAQKPLWALLRLPTYMSGAHIDSNTSRHICREPQNLLRNGSVRPLKTVWVSKCVSKFRRVVCE